MANMSESLVIELNSGKSVCLEPLQRNKNRVAVADFDPDLVVLNNDLSSGHPKIWDLWIKQ